MSTNSFDELLKKRRSIRKYTNESIDDRTIEQLVEAATLAPSGCDCQNWQFIAVKSENVMSLLVNACEEGVKRVFRDCDEKFIASRIKQTTFFKNAPVAFFVYKTKMTYYDKRVIENLERYGIPQEESMNFMGQPDVLGVAAAIENLLLKATDLGLGACWMCDPVMYEPEISKTLDVPSDWKLISVIPVGKNNGYNPREKKLKDINEILSIR